MFVFPRLECCEIAYAYQHKSAVTLLCVPACSPPPQNKNRYESTVTNLYIADVEEHEDGKLVKCELCFDDTPQAAAATTFFEEGSSRCLSE